MGSDDSTEPHGTVLPRRESDCCASSVPTTGWHRRLTVRIVRLDCAEKRIVTLAEHSFSICTLSLRLVLFRKRPNALLFVRRCDIRL